MGSWSSYTKLLPADALDINIRLSLRHACTLRGDHTRKSVLASNGKVRDDASRPLALHCNASGLRGGVLELHCNASGRHTNVQFPRLRVTRERASRGPRARAHSTLREKHNRAAFLLIYFVRSHAFTNAENCAKRCGWPAVPHTALCPHIIVSHASLCPLFTLTIPTNTNLPHLPAY